MLFGIFGSTSSLQRPLYTKLHCASLLQTYSSSVGQILDILDSVVEHLLRIIPRLCYLQKQSFLCLLNTCTWKVDLIARISKIKH